MQGQVRSENGFGFLRPGLKTGVENGILGLKLGLDLEMRAAHPHQKFQGVPLPPGKSRARSQIDHSNDVIKSSKLKWNPEPFG